MSDLLMVGGPLAGKYAPADRDNKRRVFQGKHIYRQHVYRFNVKHNAKGQKDVRAWVFDKLSEAEALELYTPADPTEE